MPTSVATVDSRSIWSRPCTTEMTVVIATTPTSALSSAAPPAASQPPGSSGVR
jgi:hypothetical protein